MPIRAIEQQRVKVVEHHSGRVLEEIEYSKAFFAVSGGCGGMVTRCGNRCEVHSGILPRSTFSIALFVLIIPTFRWVLYDPMYVLSFVIGYKLSLIWPPPPPSRYLQVHEGAVYLQQARSYVVTSLDLQQLEARCVRRSVRYYTSTIDVKRVEITGGTLVRAIAVQEASHHEQERGLLCSSALMSMNLSPLSPPTCRPTSPPPARLHLPAPPLPSAPPARSARGGPASGRSGVDPASHLKL